MARGRPFPFSGTLTMPMETSCLKAADLAVRLSSSSAAAANSTSAVTCMKGSGIQQRCLYRLPMHWDGENLLVDRRSIPAHALR